MKLLEFARAVFCTAISAPLFLFFSISLTLSRSLSPRSFLVLLEPFAKARSTLTIYKSRSTAGARLSIRSRDSRNELGETARFSYLTNHYRFVPKYIRESCWMRERQLWKIWDFGADAVIEQPANECSQCQVYDAGAVNRNALRVIYNGHWVRAANSLENLYEYVRERFQRRETEIKNGIRYPRRLISFLFYLCLRCVHVRPEWRNETRYGFVKCDSHSPRSIK